MSQPALLTSTSIGAAAFSTASTAASTLARSVMSTLERERLAAGGVDRRGDVLGAGVIDVEQRDQRAFRAEPQRDRAADARRRAGDGDDLVLQSAHVWLLGAWR